MIKSDGARRRSTRLSALLVSWVATLVLAHPVPAQESPEPRRAEAGGREAALGLLREEAIERRKDLETMERLPAVIRRNTLDKGAIAAEVHASMKTLEEMGRPHIPEGFLLKQVRDDPDRQVRAERRSAYHARMVSSRGIGQSPSEAYRALHGSPSRPVTEKSGPAVPTDCESGRWQGAVVLAGVLLVVLGFFVRRWRRGGKGE